MTSENVLPSHTFIYDVYGSNSLHPTKIPVETENLYTQSMRPRPVVVSCDETVTSYCKSIFPTTKEGLDNTKVSSCNKNDYDCQPHVEKRKGNNDYNF